ncbi:nitroreductase [Mycobacterium sp. WMMD1722]|uniref:nitroreductase n=1 Tax=Mycobacterium sp. WMMD1722 TaxID=3404117 RepID=UPI003BF48070
MATAFPDVPVLERALDLAARSPSTRNAQPWRWLVDRRGVHLMADWNRRLGDTDSDRRDVVLSCGAVLHHCSVALGAAGWAARIRRIPGDGVLAVMELDRRAPGEGIVELAGAIARRRTDRRPYRGALPAGTLELLVVHAARVGVQVAVVPTDRWGRTGAQEVTLRYPDSDNPQRAGDHDDDATMLVLATGGDTDELRLRAGEALSDLTLSATALGLATCPLTEPLSDTRDRLALACDVFDGEAYPQALLRIGRQPNPDPLPPADRRPVAETTTFRL